MRSMFTNVSFSGARSFTKKRSFAALSPRSRSSDTASKVQDDTITANATVDRAALAAQCVRPRAIFPWRSSPVPLDRLTKPPRPRFGVNGELDEIGKARLLEEYMSSDYFSKGGHLGPGWVTPMEPWFRGTLYGNSLRLLGLSWPSIIMPWTRIDWEHDMELAFCNAFSIGVKGMIADTYKLTGSEMNHDEDRDKQEDEENGSFFDVNLDVSLDPFPLAGRSGGIASPTDTNTSEQKGPDTDGEEEEHNMLQRNLRNLYQSAREHSQPSKINIVLRSTPQTAQIESMFPVLGLSRSLVDLRPNLRHTYRNLMNHLKQQNKDAVLAGGSRLNPIQMGTLIMEGLEEIMERSANLAGDGKSAITIVAQVSINCREIFCVQNVDSGDIIQGDVRPRDVTHLVRFEMVVREKLVDVDSQEDPDDGDWDMELGQWQITDWDDLLDGNVFFT